ncbi:MAG: dephospho-CoA kinase [Armatimonadetes bacterium]|nr:dephospho-CoA kinase [Armatimonadota bacterium]
MAILQIALTGGIAEGKTTVLRALSEFGVRTASADEIAREVLEDPAVSALVAQSVGLAEPLDRDELGRAIAADPAKRRALNSILHPEILARMIEARADVIEVPLLVETCLQGAFRRTWVVTCGHEEQLKRLTRRFGDEGQALRTLALQLPTKVKCAFADRIIRTDRPIDSVVSDVRELARPGSAL